MACKDLPFLSGEFKSQNPLDMCHPIVDILHSLRIHQVLISPPT